MTPLTLDWICAEAPGRLYQGRPDTVLQGVSIDTRNLAAQSLFVALAGSRTHGVEFVAEAARAGAAAVLVPYQYCQRALELASGLPVIGVDSTERALGRLAQAYRRESPVRAAAITGSVGKTTTCRYLHSLLSGIAPTHRPPASYNNQLGVPLTILNAPADTQYLICELGTSRLGEIERLARIVMPSVSAVTAVAPAHLDGLLSLEGVAHEKLSILESVRDNGEGWIPTTVRSRHRSLLKSLSLNLRTFGPRGDLEVKRAMGSEFEVWLEGERVAEFRWVPPFSHSVQNLEVALAVGHGLGQSIEALVERVPELKSPPLRGETQTRGGVEFLLDCYNANPASMASAIEELASSPARGKRVCVVGRMEELGRESNDWHHEIGGRIAQAQVDQVYLVGAEDCGYSAGLERGGVIAERISSDQHAAARLAERLAPGDRILFKASRKQQLELLAEEVARLIEARES